MKTHLLLILLASAALVAAQAADPDMLGKTVVFKTAKQGSTGIYLDQGTLKIGPLAKAAADASAFKVTAGPAAGTVFFESVQQPGFYLRHANYHLLLLKDTHDDAVFRIVPPLRGNLGVSIQAHSFPTYHLAITEKGTLDMVMDLKDPRKAIFHIEERK